MDYAEDRVCITPLGGVDDVGARNCYLVSYQKHGLLLDCGQKIPEGEGDRQNLGPEFFPDFSFIQERGIEITAIVASHGHIDHIGGIPHFFSLFNRQIPVVGSRLTRRVLDSIVFASDPTQAPTSFSPTGRIVLGPFTVEMFPVIHSIPDACGIRVEVGGESILYLGDFKTFGDRGEEEQFFQTMTKMNTRGVSALLVDATNPHEEGPTLPEHEAITRIHEVMNNHRSGRIVIATFSSHLKRLTAILEKAYKQEREVFVAGRSMRNYLALAEGHHYSWSPYARSRDENFPETPFDAVILMTGSQGEPNSALWRFAQGELPLSLEGKRDALIVAANTIPKPHIIDRVGDVIHGLSTRATNIYLAPRVAAKNEYGNVTRDDFHVSGHGMLGDYRRLFAALQPMICMPVHGDRERRGLLAPIIPTQTSLVLLEQGESLVL